MIIIACIFRQGIGKLAISIVKFLELTWLKALKGAQITCQRHFGLRKIRLMSHPKRLTIRFKKSFELVPRFICGLVFRFELLRVLLFLYFCLEKVFLLFLYLVMLFLDTLFLGFVQINSFPFILCIFL